MKARRNWLFACAAALLGLAGLVALGLAEARSMPLQRNLRIEFPDLPQATTPVRVALLSDLHIGDLATSPARLARVVALVNAAHPDAVVIVGDFVNGDASRPDLAHPELLYPLASFKAPLGVFATLGNHDHWTDPARVRKTLESMKIKVLVNGAARMGPFALAGIDDATTGYAKSGLTLVRAAQLGGIPIVVTHSPSISWWIRMRAPVMLAGHTHCGQVAFGTGASALYPTELIKGRPIPTGMRCGVFRFAPMISVVTAGIGTGGIPLRYGAPPDWWMITLAPVASSTR